MSFRVDTIPNRNFPPTVLLRRHWREGRRVRKETVANFTRRAEWLVEGIRSLVGAGVFRPEGGGTLEIRRSLPHGQATAILGTMKGLGFERILSREDNRNRHLVLAAIARGRRAVVYR